MVCIDRKRCRPLWWLVVVSVMCVVASMLAGCDKPLPAGGVDRNKMVVELEKERDVLVELSNALRDGHEQLGKQQYPDSLMAQLDSIEVPAPDWKGHDISKLPPVLVEAMLRYGGDLRVLAKRKGQVKRMLESAKPKVMAHFEDRENPTIPFSVLIENTPNGPKAVLVKNSDPFVAKGPWPEIYTVVRKQGKRVKKLEAKRYKLGAPEGMVIPIDQDTSSGLTDERIMLQLNKVLRDAAALLDGSASPTSQTPDPGLIGANKQLVEAIKALKVVRTPG